MELVFSRKARIGERAIVFLIDQFIIAILLIIIVVITAIYKFI